MAGGAIEVGRGNANKLEIRSDIHDACRRAIGLTQRPPLDQFLAQKDEILVGEELLDEGKYYTD